MGKKKKKLDEKWKKHLKEEKELTAVSKILTRTFNEIESRSIGTSVYGIPINFYDLDAMTQGLHRGSLIILGGRPAMGKTSFSLNIAKNVAELHDLPVCIFSIEMSKEQVTYRLLSSEVGIESGRLRTGRIQQEEWPILGHGVNTLSKLPLFICDKATITVDEMTETCEKIKKEQKKELGLVVIDYVQLLDGPKYPTRDEELSKVVIALKEMATKLEVPVILLSQLNRDLEERVNKRPMLIDIRESQSLESHADIVMMIYRDEYYDPDTADRGITEIITCKHRNGPLGTVKLLFEPQFTRFRNLAA